LNQIGRKEDTSDGYDNISAHHRGRSGGGCAGLPDIPQKAREGLVAVIAVNTRSEGATMALRDITRATSVGTRITIADTFLTRLIGLVGSTRLDSGCGLLIRPSSGIHTFGMLFSIDAVALSRDLRVLKLWHRLPPFRMTSIHLRTHSMLELPAGQISNCQMQVGDQLELV
jgi:uncharacterized membrane protein (UPF0127 family)